MKETIRKLLGSGRPRIIAVVGFSRVEVAEGVAHARTSGAGLPIWAWCAGEAGEIDGCERVVSGASAVRVRKDLAAVWPALTVASWNRGSRGAAMKLVPLTVPPFRIVIRNEAGGFFPARPGPILAHLRWRASEAVLSMARSSLGAVLWLWNTAARRMWHWARGAAIWLGSAVHNSGELLWSLLLAMLAVFAQLAHPAHALARAAVGKRDAQSDTRALSECGASTTEVLFSGRIWERRRLLRALDDSGSDFIVLRRRGETADAQPLVELARESGAFSVARQLAWSGWRKTVAARHPFRRLQPGEAAEVLAPWSTLIVFRRDALEELGVPHAATIGAALMILHWRAAAAGRKSFVLGHAEDITQEPGMELEDAEFAVRMLTSRSLPGLIPVQRSLRRGNIACSPALCRPLRDRPRVLVVSPYLPFPLAHGGAVRIYNLCRALSDRVDFILVARHEAGETICYDELHEVFREVYAVDRDEKVSGPPVPAQVAEYRSSSMAGLIRHLCASRRVDILQLEYTQMAEFRHHAPGVPAILVEHDITFTLHQQLAEANPFDRASREQFELWQSFERRALAGLDAVWTMSERDNALAIDNGARREHATVVPNGADLRRFRPNASAGAERTVLFVGSFRHLPNLLAYEALVESIMPAVWKELPDVRLHVIAGPDPAAWAAAARKIHLFGPDSFGRDPRIDLEGFVADVRPAYQECSVVAIPLPVSAGTNIKLMEAMACGRAVVSTPVGCQGLGLVDGVDLLIRENGPEFADALVRLFQESRLRENIAARAHQTAEARFGWDAIAEKAYADYARLTGRADGQVWRQSGIGPTGESCAQSATRRA